MTDMSDVSWEPAGTGKGVELVILPPSEIETALADALAPGSVVEAWVVVAQAIDGDGQRYEVSAASPEISRALEVGLLEVALELAHTDTEVDERDDRD